MSTAPNPTVSTSISIGAVKQDLHKISTYILTHERLIILLISLAVGVHFYTKVLNLIERHDQRKDNLDHAALAVKQQANAQQDQASQAALQQYQQLVSDLKQEIATLRSNQDARDKATTVQQAADRQLAPPALAARWSSLTGVTTDQILANADKFVVTQMAAQETVVQLEQVPQLKADLSDEQKINTALSSQITGLSTVNLTYSQQINGLKDTLSTQTATCEQDKKVLRDQARKGKFKWFAIGYGAGLATRDIIKIFTGF